MPRLILFAAIAILQIGVGRGAENSGEVVEKLKPVAPCAAAVAAAEARKIPLNQIDSAVGMLAEKPGEKETYLTFRVISAKRNREAAGQ